MKNLNPSNHLIENPRFDKNGSLPNANHSDLNQYEETNNEVNDENTKHDTNKKFIRYVPNQSLVSVLNDPKMKIEQTYEKTIVKPPKRMPKISIKNFKTYYDKVREDYRLFEKTLLPKNQFGDYIIDYSDLNLVSEKLQIPKVFFEKAFNLKDKETFDFITNLNNNSEILQQMLSYYLDQVELELIKQIELRSESFFYALSSIKDLNNQISLHIQEITKLRQNIANMKEEMKNSLNAAILYNKKTNAEKALEILEVMSRVKKDANSIDQLISKGDFGSAFKLIRKNKERIRTELMQITCLQPLMNKLTKQSERVEKEIITEFIGIVCDLPDMDNYQENERLGSILLSLIILNKMDEAWSSSKQRYAKIVNIRIEKSIYSVYKTSETKIDLPNISHQNYVEVLDNVFSEMLTFMNNIKKTSLKFSEIVKIESNVLLELSNLVKSNETVPTNFFEKNLIVKEDLQNIETLLQKFVGVDDYSKDFMIQVCDYIHSSIVSFMQRRTLNNLKIPILDFVAFVEKINAFVEVSEKIPERKSTALLHYTTTLYKDYINAFHEKQVQLLTNFFDSEGWTQTSISAVFQDIVDKVVSCEPLKNFYETKNYDTKIVSTEIKSKEGSFKMFSCSMVMIKLVAEYLYVAKESEIVGVDMAIKASLILKFFNAKLREMILGRKAMDKLKNISAKHLALTSQNISFFISFIPYLIAYFQKVYGNENFKGLEELKKQITEYEKHKELLFQQIVDIMKERLKIHTDNFNTLSFKLTHSNEKNSPYVAEIIKETSVILTILNKILPSVETQSIILNIYKAYNTFFLEFYNTIKLPTKNTKTRMLNDIQLLISGLNEIYPGMKNDLELYFNKRFG